MSSGRVFQSLGPATANERSPTVTSRDRGMTSSEEVDDRRWHLDVMSETQCSRSDRYRGAVSWALRRARSLSILLCCFLVDIWRTAYEKMENICKISACASILCVLIGRFSLGLFVTYFTVLYLLNVHTANQSWVKVLL